MPALGRASSVIGILAAASSLLVSPPAARADPVDTTALVLRVVDGDTVDIVDDVRGRLRVRLLGIDSPETKKPRFSVGCWGPEASQFAESTLAGQRVALVTDPTQDLHDRYGRTLAYLDKADGWDYSVEAARAGAAHAYIYHDQPAARYPAIAAARRKQSMRSEACGVRPAMATPNRIPFSR
jgi:micrococcal nuclease